MSTVSHLAVAPLSSSTRRRLAEDATNIPATAKRKGLTLDEWEHHQERAAASSMFELGCWLHYYSRRVSGPHVEDRIDCLRRLFEAGVKNPGYKFSTVFDFGERTFDCCVEMGDGEVVVDALVKLAKLSPGSPLERCVEYMGWMDRAPRQPELFAL